MIIDTDTVKIYCDFCGKFVNMETSYNDLMCSECKLVITSITNKITGRETE